MEQREETPFSQVLGGWLSPPAFPHRLPLYLCRYVHMRNHSLLTPAALGRLDEDRSLHFHSQRAELRTLHHGGLVRTIAHLSPLLAPLNRAVGKHGLTLPSLMLGHCVSSPKEDENGSPSHPGKHKAQFGAPNSTSDAFWQALKSLKTPGHGQAAQ